MFSADGSTAVTIVLERTAADPDPREITVIARDATTGALRATYVLPLTLNGPTARLSRDGSRLVLAVFPGLAVGTTARIDPPEWHVVETATGKTLAVVPSDPGGRWPTETWIDPDARRLYRLLLPLWPDNPGPGPALIVAHDLTTGAEIGGLQMPEVLGGTWDTGAPTPTRSPM